MRVHCTRKVEQHGYGLPIFSAILRAGFPEVLMFTGWIFSDVMTERLKDCNVVDSEVGLPVETVAREGMCKRFYCVLFYFGSVTGVHRLLLAFVKGKRNFLCVGN
jgi:hypothetical protein